MEYGYIRVSTAEQNIDRQLYEMLEHQNILKENIFIDYASGKDFERVNYQKMMKLLQKNDLLVIHSIDRLGRTYDGIVEQWSLITKKIGANIFVVDMPLLDTREKENGITARLISDIVLQLLSYVAQIEREKIHERQKEGIARAKAKGKHLGRPIKTLPSNFNQVCYDFERGIKDQTRSAELLNMSRATFIKYYKKNFL